MAKLEIKKRVLSVNVFGTDYEIDFPNRRQVREYNKDLKKTKDEDADLCLTRFLDSLGLPEEASDEMEVSDVLKVLKTLIPEMDEKK